MTTATIDNEVRQAAEFIQRHHKFLAIDHPAMEFAINAIKAAGLWSVAELGLDISTSQAEPKITMVMHGTFCANDRRRIVYRILADGQQIGTATCWTSKTLWPWGLSLPAGNVINFGFKSRSDLMQAVERFVRTGEI